MIDYIKDHLDQPIPAETVTVTDQPELTLAYVRHTGPYLGDEQLFQRCSASAIAGPGRAIW